MRSYLERRPQKKRQLYVAVVRMDNGKCMLPFIGCLRASEGRRYTAVVVVIAIIACPLVRDIV